MFYKHKGDEMRLSCLLFKKISLDSNPLESLFKKIVVSVEKMAAMKLSGLS